MNALRIIIPLGLGLTAGVLNYFVVRGMAAPLELVGVAKNVSDGAELKADSLVKVAVRADSPDILKSAVPWVDRGAVVDRRVSRPLAAGEVVLFADVRSEAPQDVQTLLRAGEMSVTVSAPAARVAPGLRAGDTVGLLVADPDGEDGEGARRVLGPYRLLWVGTRSDPFRAPGTADVRRMTVAAPVAAGGALSPLARDLDAALSAGGGAGGHRSRVLAVEYMAPAGR